MHTFLVYHIQLAARVWSKELIESNPAMLPFDQPSFALTVNLEVLHPKWGIGISVLS